MKIEIGESLVYSWLRHVKGCQIVQTNWKTSTQWNLMHEEELEKIYHETDAFFRENYKYEIYKKSSSLSQVILQAECDALGISFSDDEKHVFAVDVAFHESGLRYGSRSQTVMKILNKCIRTAMCIYGYLDVADAEVIFAAPKIGQSILGDVTPALERAEQLLNKMGYGFKFRLIANSDFKNVVLDPILLASDGVADTHELFLRSYQMLQMYGAAEK